MEKINKQYITAISLSVIAISILLSFNKANVQVTKTEITDSQIAEFVAVCSSSNKSLKETAICNSTDISQWKTIIE